MAGRNATEYAPSSAVASVLFYRGSTSYTPETKSGAYIYWGDSANFHEWEFRTRLRFAGRKDDQYSMQMSIVVEGLKGDAFVVAKDIVGLAKLQEQCNPDLDILSGLEHLVTA